MSLSFNRRRLIVTAASLAVVSSWRVSAATPEAASAFISKLGGEAISVLSDKGMTTTQREDTFRRLFISSFDIDAISQFVLGRYWRTATEAQRAEYQKLFTDFIVASYANKLGQYSGEKFVVKEARNDTDGDSIVQSVIERPDPNAPPVKVEWRMRGSDADPKITDVVVEGVSMALTHRSEFASVIQNGGGNVEALLNALRKKAASR